MSIAKSALKSAAALVLAMSMGCPASDASTSSTPASAPAPAVVDAAPAPVPVPTPDEAVAVVGRFYAQYTDTLTPALTALFTDAQRARADAHAKECAAAKPGELPAACEADPYTCAQDDVKMAAGTFVVPNTVVVAATDFPDVKVDVAVKDVGGRWKIDGFTCREE